MRPTDLMQAATALLPAAAIAPRAAAIALLAAALSVAPVSAPRAQDASPPALEAPEAPRIVLADAPDADEESGDEESGDEEGGDEESGDGEKAEAEEPDPDADLEAVVALYDLEERLEKALRELKSDDPAVWGRAERRAKKLFARSGSPSFDLLLKRGRDAIEKKDLDAALEHLTDLTILGPDFAEGWRMRALVHLANQDPADALGDMMAAVSLEPRNFEALFLLASLFERFEAPDQAYRALEKALAIHPNYAPALKARERLRIVVEGDDA